MQKGKTDSEEALQISYEKKRSERQRRKGKIYPFKYRVPKKTSSLISAKK